MSDIEAKRAANRAAFPAVAAVVDEFRAAFGEVKVLGGTELATGKSFGNGGGEQWPGCAGCDGRKPCDHPQRESSFCGFREREERVHGARLWVEAGCPRMARARADDDFPRLPRRGAR